MKQGAKNFLFFDHAYFSTPFQPSVFNVGRIRHAAEA